MSEFERVKKDYIESIIEKLNDATGIEELLDYDCRLGCPSGYGLEDSLKCPFKECRDCWKRALKEDSNENCREI